MTAALRKCPERYVETVVDDETVLMDLDSGDFFSLTDSGADIWALIDGTRSREAILAELATAYALSEADLAFDVDCFLGELRGAGLITES